MQLQKPFISPVPMSSAFFCLPTAIWNLLQFSPSSPFSRATSCTSFPPTKPCSGAHQFSALIFHPTYLLSLSVWLAASVLLKPSCLLCGYVLFWLPLVSFVRILPYVQNTHVHFLAQASICCLPGVLSWCHRFLYSLQCVGNSLHPFLLLLLSWCCFLQCSLYLEHPPPIVSFLNQPPGADKSEMT